MIKKYIKQNNKQLSNLYYRYHDFDLKPGSEYSYTVTSHNSEGDVTSPVATETTPQAAPSGMQPPVLTPTSTSSVLVEWEKPLNENGVIQNYTVVVEGKSEEDKQVCWKFLA